MFSHVINLMPEGRVELFKTEYDIYSKVHKDDIEICDAFTLYKLFKYSNAYDGEERVELIKKLIDDGVTIDKSLLEAVQIISTKDSYEFNKIEDVSALAEVILLKPLIPLGYVSEEIIRRITLHEEIQDEDVESYIDSMLQVFIKIFFMKTEEVKELAIRDKMLLFNKIETIVSNEADLNLMLQIKEISRIILEWSV